ncbi:hypothetical protein TL16_g00756 [Triparma laevis f. inornata]|uniref:Uncharacterized protein n=2 Tax=Triparma laevis TaxID=1534972 RepID=A0A9W6ZDT7_9STRA|nr:hypothetical protein TL16_g00756 [Triparma laevis f. inornata]
MLNRGNLRKSTPVASSFKAGGITVDFKKDSSVFRVTPSSDLRVDFDSMMVELEKQSPEGFVFQRKKPLIKQNNRLLLKSGAGGRRRDDDAPLKAHLGKRRLNMSMTHKSIDKRDPRMSLLKRGRNEESEGEESDEKLKEKKGRKSPIMELMEKNVFEGEKVTFSKDHAEIVLHKKHVIPGLRRRQENTLWSGWEGKVDSSWLERYNNDRADYQSLSVHANLKLEESKHLGKKGVIPLHASIAISVFHLFEGLPRMVKVGKGIGMVLDRLMHSVFIFEDGDFFDSRRGGPSLEHLLTLPTHFDQAGFFFGMLKSELKVRPLLLEKLERLKKERELEANVLNRACTFWANHILRNIMYRWRTCVEQEHKRMLMGKFLLQMTALKSSTVFKKWKEWYMKEKADREKSRWRTAKDDAKRLGDETDAKKNRVKMLSAETRNLKTALELVKRELKEKLLILNDPARQKTTLGKIVCCMGRSIQFFNPCLMETMESSIRDLNSKGVENLRLSTLMTFEKDQFLPFGEFAEEERWDEQVEDDIMTWKPGKLKSKEFSWCFTPLETRAGRILKRFVNYCLLHEMQGKRGIVGSTPTIPLRTLGVKGVLDSHAVPFETFEDMTSCNNYVALLNYFSKVCKKQVQVLDTHNDERKLPEEFSKEHKNVHTAHLVLYHCKVRSKPACARFVTLDDLTKLKIPKSDAALELETDRLKAKKKEDEAKGVIIHMMSQYCGQRVHIKNVSDTRCFAMLSEMFFYHYKRFGVGVQGMGKFLNELFHKTLGGCMSAHLEVVKDLVNFTPWFYSHEQLGELARELQNNLVVIKTSANTSTRHILRSYEDRIHYREVSNELISCCWQGNCTSILSRKVRTEEDIDDGTYTTVRKEQVDNEFRRLGIMEEEEREEECAKMKAILKTRIRDIRRIFQFYAAVSDSGGVTELDHQECWKFVKDCRLQKDRKALPSVRVDLIFQSCTIDHSKKGLDRVKSVRPELGPTQFVEFIARLASYRYNKGSWSERLERMINEDILPNACSVDIDVFRERIAGDKCKAVVKKHRHNMEVIYKDYAAEDQSLESLGSLDTMNANELVACCRDFKLVGPLLSERAVKVLFAYVQHDEELIEELKSKGKTVNVVDEGDDDEMVFAEYTESQMAIGAQMNPDPYNVLNIRIDRYFSLNLINKALDMVNLFVSKLLLDRILLLVLVLGARDNDDEIATIWEWENYGRNEAKLRHEEQRSDELTSFSRGGGSRRGSFCGEIGEGGEGGRVSRRPSFAGEMRRKSFSGKDKGGGIASADLEKLRMAMEAANGSLDDKVKTKIAAGDGHSEADSGADFVDLLGGLNDLERTISNEIDRF